MLRHKGRWGIVTMLRHKERRWDNGHPCKGIKEGGGIAAMLRHKGWWWDSGHVKA